ncbi:MAG: hypothetical protein ISS49_05335 [Anaerolineae bacterium]|nr:hypothetical protein [Anaerolineae bacterium]
MASEREPMPPEFWEDEEWAFANYERWMEEYPDQWIAVANEKVVAAEKDPVKAREIAKEKTGRRHIPVIFVEKTFRFYQNRVGFQGLGHW